MSSGSVQLQQQQYTFVPKGPLVASLLLMVGCLASQSYAGNHETSPLCLSLSNSPSDHSRRLSATDQMRAESAGASLTGLKLGFRCRPQQPHTQVCWCTHLARLPEQVHLGQVRAVLTLVCSLCKQPTTTKLPAIKTLSCNLVMRLWHFGG